MESPVAPAVDRPPAEREGHRRLLVWGIGVLIVAPALSWPLQGVAYWVGVPGGAIRWTIGSVPDVVAGALVLAGLVQWARRRQRPDRLDLAAAAFVSLLAGYLVADQLALAAGHDLFDQGPDGSFIQVLALRAAIVAPLLLVALRSFAWPRVAVAQLLDLVQVAGVVLGAGAVFEAVWPDAWEHLGTDVLALIEFRRAAYGIITPDALVVYTGVGDQNLVRAGSFLLEHLQLGFILIPALSVSLLRTARSPRATQIAALVVIGGGLLATLGRAAVACAAVAALLVLVTRPPGPERRRLQRIGAAGTVLVVIAAIATGLVSRFVSTTDHGDESTTVHVDATRAAVDLIGDHPLGVGLGTGLAAATRPHPGVSVVSENAYLDIGVQGGVAAVVLWLVVLAGLLGRLWRARTSGDVAVVALASIVALALGGLVLHTWQMLETTWVVFALAALALPRAAGDG